MTQIKYALDILDYAQMTDCKPTSSSMMPKTKGLTFPFPFSDSTLYRNLVGAF